MASPEILDSAAAFFGEQGLGLEETERNPCCVSFEGGGGYVSVTIADGEKKRSVDVETREWEYQVKKFLGKL
jgi:hypothetical protein